MVSRATNALKQFWAYVTDNRPPRRLVVSRLSSGDGDHIKLECGHQVHVTLHQRLEYPCDACFRASKMIEPTDPWPRS